MTSEAKSTFDPAAGTGFISTEDLTRALKIDPTQLYQLVVASSMDVVAEATANYEYTCTVSAVATPQADNFRSWLSIEQAPEWDLDSGQLVGLTLTGWTEPIANSITDIYGYTCYVNGMPGTISDASVEPYKRQGIIYARIMGVQGTGPVFTAADLQRSDDMVNPGSPVLFFDPTDSPLLVT